jgi:2-methylcitrate dehydratase PrpD
MRRRPLDPSEIDSIQILLPDGMSMADWNIDLPSTALESKFSARACVAFTVLGWDTSSLDTYTEERLVDPHYLSLVKRVSVQAVEASSPLDWTKAEAIVRLTRGETIKQTIDIRNLEGARRLEQITSKFHLLAEPVLGEDRSTNLVQSVMGLERVPRIAEVVDLLAK